MIQKRRLQSFLNEVTYIWGNEVLKYLPLIGISLFGYIIWSIGAIKILGSLETINIRFFFLSVILLVPLVAIKALKWKILIDSYKNNFTLSKCMSAWFIGYFLGSITPGRLGDLSRAFYLAESNKSSFVKSLTTVVLDRIIDVLILFCLASVGIFALITFYTLQGLFFIKFMALFSFFLIIIFISFKKDFLRLMLKPFFNVFVPEKHKNKVSLNFYEFYEGAISIINKKIRLFSAMVLSLVSWFASIFVYFFIAKGLNLDISYPFLVFIIPISLLLEILPVSFSGLGTREAAFIFLLSFINIPPEAAVSFSISILLLNYLNALPGLLLWFKKPIKL